MQYYTWSYSNLVEAKVEGSQGEPGRQGSDQAWGQVLEAYFLKELRGVESTVMQLLLRLKTWRPTELCKASPRVAMH